MENPGSDERGLLAVARGMRCLQALQSRKGHPPEDFDVLSATMSHDHLGEEATGVDHVQVQTLWHQGFVDRDGPHGHDVLDAGTEKAR